MTPPCVIRGLDDLPPGRFTRPVVTLGTFDGVHLGHQRVIGETVDWARGLGGQAVVITFERHPRRVLRGKAPSLLLSVADRLDLICRLGVGGVVVLPFTQALAQTAAMDFALDVLRDRIGAAGLVLGHDAAFGRDREGTAAFLNARSSETGFEVREADAVVVGGRAVSSSAIRTAIAAGDLAAASAMLGRPVFLSGTVVMGRGLGRELGWPTANLELHHDVLLPAGVWQGHAGMGGACLKAVISIGRSPTVGPGLPQTVEVHLIDFNEDLYGRKLRVEVTGHLREQKTFATLQALAAAISHDVETVRQAGPCRSTERATTPR